MPTSRATRVTSPANAFSWSTIVLMVFFSSRISPFHVDRDLARQIAAGHSRRDFGDVSHLAGQVAGHRVHGVGQILPRSGHARHLRLAAEFAFGSDFARHARHFGGERVQLIHHRVDGFFQQQNFAAHVDRDFLRQVAAGDCRRYFGDVSHLAGQVAGHGVHGVGEILPRSADAGHQRLSAEFAVGADFAGHARHFRRERSQLIHHRVDGVFEFENFALHIDRDLARQIAASHGRRHFGDVSHLASQVAGHEVHVVGEILPRSGHARHLRLAAQLAFGADFAGHARHFAGERVELVHHRVDGVLQFENFAFHVDRDLARQIAASHGRRNFGDVSHLASQVAGHGVHGVGEILPRAGDARHVRLSAQPAFGTDFAGHARHFTGESIELIHHRVQRFFELQNFAAHVDRDLARQIAAGDGGRDFRDVSHLAGQVAGHEVHVVGKIFPRTADAGHLRLAAQLAFRADFARHARHFAGERVELIHHRVDGVFEFENFAFHVDRDLAGQVAAGHSRRDFGDVSHLRRQVAGHGVDGVGEIFPRAGHAGHDGLSAKFSVGADFARHARHFRRERSQLVHHRVDGFFELQNFAAHIDRDLARQVAAGHGGRDFGDVAHLAGQVAGHQVHVVGEIFPGSGYVGHLRLSAQLAFRADFAGHARHFGGEHAELLNHRVDEVRGAQEFAFQRTPIHVEPNGLRQIALRNGCDGARDFGRRPKQVFHQRVDRNFHLAPGAPGLMKSRPLPRFALLADHLADALQFLRHVLVGGDDLVERVGNFSRQAHPRTREAAP